MSNVSAYIKGSLLRWARARARLSLEQVAQKATVSQDKLRAWEDERSQPSIRQAQKLAHILRIPFGFLFLSSPPQESPVLPDLRTVADATRDTYSADFLELLSDVLRKQRWYREFLKSEEVESLPFIGRFRIGADANQVAEDVSQCLGINETLRSEAQTWENFLTKLIERAEGLRIVVMRTGIVGSDTHRPLSVDEFRGFAITDDIAPLIFLNGKDSKAAQIFTLAHELAHLWIGQSGISNLYLGRRPLSSDNQIERFCNSVAAEVLVPQGSFLTRWSSNRAIDETVKNLTRYYRVSTLVILNRAFGLRKLSWLEYSEKYNAEEERLRALERKREQTGGDYYASVGTRNGKELAKAVVSAAYSERLLYRDAASLLGIGVSKLDRVATELGVR